MSFHPNEVQRRGRVASVGVAALLLVLAAAFFRTQVVDYERYALQSETNRLREVPLPAPRGIILDRNGLVIAENIPGYTVSVISQGKDSLRAVLRRLSRIVSLADDQIEAKVKSYLAAPSRPAVVLSDATFEEVSVLEEHRTEFPGLIIQASPKRYYPDGPAVSAVVGYTGQINDRELTQSTYRDYKPGQDIGRAGIERQYESRLRGREGARFVEVDAQVLRRFGTAGRRDRHGSRDGRRPRVAQRAELRSEPFHRRDSHRLLARAEQRSEKAALQQGDAGHLSAGIDLQARHGDHRATGEGRHDQRADAAIL
jgi:penicillin-binding protein 2